MTPDELPLTVATPCPRCQQAKSVDSLTGRCISCQPIQIGELPPDFQAYARRAEYQKYKELVIGLLSGPVLIAIYFFYASSAKGAPQWLLWALLVATLALIGGSAATFFRKRSLLRRYHRLAYVMQHVNPVEAELQYEVIGGGEHSRSRRYFNVRQLAPGSTWPNDIGRRIEIDIPPKSESQVVAGDFWKTFFSGYDPRDKPKLWGKVYFDPDHSGSAVICIQDGVFLSVRENN
jgi:hypothetical protein